MTDQRLPISLWKYYRMNYLVHAIVLLVILVFAAAEQNFVIVGFCTLAIVTTIIGAWLKHKVYLKHFEKERDKPSNSRL